MKTRRRPPKVGFGVEQRWTPTIARYGFAPVASLFLSTYARLEHPLTIAEAMLVIHIMSFKWGKKDPWPSLASLAALMGCSERYIGKLCKSLESVGYLVRKRGSHRSKDFDLSGLFKALEKVAPALEPEAPQESPDLDTLAEMMRQRLGLSVPAPSPAAPTPTPPWHNVMTPPRRMTLRELERAESEEPPDREAL